MTLNEFRLPDLGEGLTEAEVVRWLVRPGARVRIDEPIVEVVTAKAAVELPSPFEGIVDTLHFAAGDVVEVGEVLVSIAQETTTLTPLSGGSVGEVPAPAAPSTRDPDAESGNVLVGYGTKPGRRRRRGSVRPTPSALASAGPPGADRAARATTTVPAVMSPVVRRLARERGVDLNEIRGSGPNRLITRADVEAASKSRVAAEERDTAAVLWAPASETRLPIRGLHRQMAERVTRSRREIPEATVWVDVDASGLIEARRGLAGVHTNSSSSVSAGSTGTGTGTGPGGTESSPHIALVSLLARFCVLGLVRWPALNSRIAGDEVVMGDTVNVGFAAQTERGLVVPVVHGAEAMSLAELDGEVKRLSAAARSGSLRTEDLTGGTFTVNNYGVFGVDGSAAIINHPEVAMIGMGRIIDRPWVVDSEVTVRPVTELTLVFDHRVCDGGVAGGFLRFVADCVEQPLRAL